MNNNFLDTENFKYLITFVFNDIKQRTSHDISNNKKYISIFKKLVQTIHKKNMNKRVSKEYLNTIVIDKCVPFIIKHLNNETGKQNAIKQPVFDNRQLNISNRPSASRSNRHPNTNTNTNTNKNDFSHLTLSEPNRNTDKLNPMDLSNMAGVASRNGDKLDYTSQLDEYQSDRNYDNQQQQPQLKSVNEIIGQKSSEDDEKIDYIKKLQELQNDRNYETQNNNMDNFEKQNNIQTNQNSTSLENVNSQNVEIDNDFMNNLYENNQNNQNNIDFTQEINNSVLNKLNNNYFDNGDDVDGGDNELVDSYPNVQLNILDKSKNDRLPEYNSNIDNLKIDYSPTKINTNLDNVKKELYQTTKQYTGVPSHIVVLENHFTGDSEDVSFKADLIEPLNIDRPADIFLEFINLQNIDDDTGDLESINCFALQIDELNIKTASNNNDLKDKYIIPNDSYGTTDNVADATDLQAANNKVDASSYTIKLKSNYMCSIKPMEITSLNIKLYSLKISTLALLQSQANGKIIIGLFIKKNF